MCPSLEPDIRRPRVGLLLNVYVCMFHAYILWPQVATDPYELHRSHSQRARSFVPSGQAPYRRQVARFAINLLPDLCPRSTLASKFIAAAARLSMKALHPTRTKDPTESHGPLRSLVLGPFSSRKGGGETGPLADILFQRVGCLQGKQSQQRQHRQQDVCASVCVSPAQCRTV